MEREKQELSRNSSAGTGACTNSPRSVVLQAPCALVAVTGDAEINTALTVEKKGVWSMASTFGINGGLSQLPLKDSSLFPLTHELSRMQ